MSSERAPAKEQGGGRPVPYGAGQERVEGVQPVVHVLVAAGLQQEAPVLRAHSKRVGRLRGRAAAVRSLEASPGHPPGARLGPLRGQDAGRKAPHSLQPARPILTRAGVAHSQKALHSGHPDSFHAQGYLAAALQPPGCVYPPRVEVPSP